MATQVQYIKFTVDPTVCGGTAPPQCAPYLEAWKVIGGKAYQVDKNGSVSKDSNDDWVMPFARCTSGTYKEEGYAKFLTDDQFTALKAQWAWGNDQGSSPCAGVLQSTTTIPSGWSNLNALYRILTTTFGCCCDEDDNNICCNPGTYMAEQTCSYTADTGGKACSETDNSCS